MSETNQEKWSQLGQVGSFIGKYTHEEAWKRTMNLRFMNQAKEWNTQP